jgi:serralysin
MASIRTGVPGSGYGSIYVDALLWGGAAWDPASGPITFHFGEAVDWAAASAVHGDDKFGLEARLEGTSIDGWSHAEKDAFRYALSVFSSVSMLTFAEAAFVEEANIVWWQAPLDQLFQEPGLVGIHEPPTGATAQTWGAFNPSSILSPSQLKAGGDGLFTIFHELGHAFGLAHPHDGGSESDATTFPGVPFGWPVSGDRGLNQGVWTVMSYNTGYDRASHSDDFGRQAGLGAFDIAALQALYGSNMSTRTGDDLYRLPLVNQPGTGWLCIWDAGGRDTISGAGSASGVTIDLRPATLMAGAAGAGGFTSQAGVIGGGFTIAKGVLIENAVGSSRNDHLTGNHAGNVLNGGRGADRMLGLRGDDIYYVDHARDVVNDTSGYDTLYTSVSFALANSARIEVVNAVDPRAKTSITLAGSSSSNTITGNAGANVINGKGGSDILTGGRGRDTFVFDAKLSSRSNVDWIRDYSHRDDTIWLDNSVFRDLTKTGFLTSDAFHVTSTSKLAHDASDRIIYSKKTGYLYYDSDGVGGDSAIKFARVDDGLRLKASEFYVV